MVNVSVKNIYSFKGGGRKSYVCKVGGGITNKFCDDGISNNKNTPPEYRKNVSEVQNYKTFPGKSSPQIAVFYYLPSSNSSTPPTLTVWL